MIPYSGLQIYIRRNVTQTLTSWPPKLIVSCPWPVNHLW